VIIVVVVVVEVFVIAGRSLKMVS